MIVKVRLADLLNLLHFTFKSRQFILGREPFLRPCRNGISPEKGIGVELAKNINQVQGRQRLMFIKLIILSSFWGGEWVYFFLLLNFETTDDRMTFF